MRVKFPITMRKTELNQMTLKDIFPPSLGKAEKTQGKIIEAALKSFTQFGIEQSNYRTIAALAGMSRSLIQHYFPEHEDLLLTSVKYVLGNFQNFAKETMRDQAQP